MNDNTHTLPPRRLSVAPMLDWTDRHYRYLARQITRNTWLYSEMVNSGAMQDAVGIPVTVKHRIGVDRQTEYQTVSDFVGTLRDKTACKTFIVHARNAWLDGLSPKENRDVPPLKYDYVYRLKQEFPELEIIINGGITTNEAIAGHLQHVDGVMVGREAYHNPMVMHEWDRLFYGDTRSPIEYADLVQRLYTYSQAQIQAGRGTILRHIVRHSLGLMHGLKNARTWRRMLSDATLLKDNDGSLILEAWKEVERVNTRE